MRCLSIGRSIFLIIDRLVVVGNLKQECRIPIYVALVILSSPPYFIRLYVKTITYTDIFNETHNSVHYNVSGGIFY